MQKKIVILSSGHPILDERIFWKFGRTLRLHGNDVTICTSTEELQMVKESITIDSFDGKNMNKKEKVNRFFSLLEKYSPSLVICCEPLTIVPASRYKKHSRFKIIVISDITEWYPENHTARLKGIKKYYNYLLLWMFNIYTSLLVDGMTIGEKIKKRRYSVIALFTRKEIVSYYPVLEYFNYSAPPFDGETITFCYAGLINYSRGILILLQICEEFNKAHPELNIRLKLAGKFENSEEQKDLLSKIKNIKDYQVNLTGWTEYPLIAGTISDADICFDLRVHNFVYDHSLPIKIFEYMAAGKPFIFTDIKPIRQSLEYHNYGHLVEPDDIPKILSILEEYVIDRQKLLRHSKMARESVEKNYNWEKESVKLINFINSFLR